MVKVALNFNTTTAMMRWYAIAVAVPLALVKQVYQLFEQSEMDSTTQAYIHVAENTPQGGFLSIHTYFTNS
jgi:hypothetical protein